MQETRVRSRIWADPSCCSGTKLAYRTYWACSSWAHRPQLASPHTLDSTLCNRRSLCAATRQKPLPLQLRPSTAKQMVEKERNHCQSKVMRIHTSAGSESLIDLTIAYLVFNPFFWVKFCICYELSDQLHYFACEYQLTQLHFLAYSFPMIFLGTLEMCPFHLGYLTCWQYSCL